MTSVSVCGPSPNPTNVGYGEITCYSIELAGLGDGSKLTLYGPIIIRQGRKAIDYHHGDATYSYASRSVTWTDQIRRVRKAWTVQMPNDAPSLFECEDEEVSQHWVMRGELFRCEEEPATPEAMQPPDSPLTWAEPASNRGRIISKYFSRTNPDDPTKFRLFGKVRVIQDSMVMEDFDGQAGLSTRSGQLAFIHPATGLPKVWKIQISEGTPAEPTLLVNGEYGIEGDLYDMTTVHNYTPFI